MDPFLRGFIEQIIDVNLGEDELKNMKAIVEIFHGGVKSKLDAHLGFLIGYSYAELMMQFMIIRNRPPNREETEQFFNLLKRRFPEMLNQIKKVKKSGFLERGDEAPSIPELDVEPLQPIQE